MEFLKENDIRLFQFGIKNSKVRLSFSLMLIDLLLSVDSVGYICIKSEVKVKSSHLIFQAKYGKFMN